LLTAIETKNQKIDGLETALKELNEEKESAVAEIANLKRELKL
jgi:molecular chaperone GrpE (heat shock protein)